MPMSNVYIPMPGYHQSQMKSLLRRCLILLCLLLCPLLLRLLLQILAPNAEPLIQRRLKHPTHSVRNKPAHNLPSPHLTALLALHHDVVKALRPQPHRHEPAIRLPRDAEHARRVTVERRIVGQPRVPHVAGRRARRRHVRHAQLRVGRAVGLGGVHHHVERERRAEPQLRCVRLRRLRVRGLRVHRHPRHPCVPLAVPRCVAQDREDQRGRRGDLRACGEREDAVAAAHRRGQEPFFWRPIRGFGGHCCWESMGA